MKIKLKNFRCHADLEIEFKDEGLTKLTGLNGTGKSTIFEAIHFAFYGTIRNPYPINAPKTGTGSKTSVELDFFGFNIVRTCRPNRLLVTCDDGVTHEDLEAQEIINQHVMNETEFLASSYIKFKAGQTLLAMTPTDQVNFVKNIAFDATSNIQLKEKIKELVRDTNEDLVKERSSLEFVERQLVELLREEGGSLLEVTKNPLRIDEQSFAKQGETLSTVISSLKKKRAETQSQIDELESEKVRNRESIERKRKLELEIESLKLNLVEKGTVVSSEELEGCEREIEELSRKRDVILARQVYLEQEQLFDEEVQEYFDSVREKVEDVQERQVSEEEYVEMVEAQKEHDEFERKKNKYSGVVRDFGKMFPGVKMERSEDVGDVRAVGEKILEYLRTNCSRILQCPSCSTFLSLESGKLVESEGEVGEEGREGSDVFDKWITILSEFENEMGGEEFEDFSEQIGDYIINKQKMEELNLILKERTLPMHLVQKSKKIEHLGEGVEDESDEGDRPEGGESPEDEQDLPSLISTIKERETFLESQWNKKSSISNLETVLANKRGMLKKLSESLGTNSDATVANLEKFLKDLAVQLEDAMNKHQEHSHTRYALSQYKAYPKHVESVKKLEEKKRELRKSVGLKEAKYNALIILREKSNLAEILALETVVNTINEYASQFLNIMFPDEPMVVRIEQFRENKSGKKDVKCQLFVSVLFRGKTYDSIDQLSGGERQKTELSFELAVNSLMNSKFLMLDECLNSLDPEVNTIITQTLSEYAREYHKSIICVAHESVEGLFDDVCWLK